MPPPFLFVENVVINIDIIPDKVYNKSIERRKGKINDRVVGKEKRQWDTRKKTKRKSLLSGKT